MIDLRKGQEVELACVRLEAGGAGLAPYGDYEVLVLGTLPGQRLRARIEHISPHRANGRTRAWGRVLETLLPSPHEVPPSCPAFGTCGGCVWQHLALAEQRAWKHTLVAEAFAARGLPTNLLAACEASPAAVAYRNQAKYVVQASSRGVVLGGYAPRSHDVVDLTACTLVEPPLAKTVNQIAASITSQPSLHAELRHVVLRASGVGQVLVTLVFRTRARAESAAARGLAAALRMAQPEIAGVVANVNGTDGDVIFGAEEFTLEGEAFVADEIAGARVHLSSRAFFQVNRHVAAAAYLAIAAFARKVGDVRRVWDVYAGVGTIARVLAAQLPCLEDAFCVEIRSSAVEDARRSEHTGRARLTFLAADAGDGLRARVGQPDLVVLNPPRAGCAPEVMEAVTAAEPRGIAYLSCLPETLARDLAWLSQQGYRITRATPFDMLPHTPHVETLVCLERV
ncbi:MAG: 23S rRNA (uracil(1939)-C(5))-methyltransferase RlmD [Myxococcales bacterium]|nr:23S rRNA (uracil(1939)-C(5))-methyltransferase RlmD [Myxococcales bacterium]